MTHCKDCGRETWPGKQICNGCLDKFTERRKKAFEQAEEEYGKLNKDNHKMITKRVRQLETYNP